MGKDSGAKLTVTPIHTSTSNTGKTYGPHVTVRSTVDGKTTNVEHTSSVGAMAIGATGNAGSK